ncbi:T9SS C-terminal target domain-containing protein, partial [bacterium]
NWSDQRNGNSNTDIFIAKSSDGGLTWSGAKKVNDDVSERHQFFTWMAIDQTTGFIYICFYDRRNTEGIATDFYLARSTDGGETFQNFKVSESSFSPSPTVFFGDYTNIAAYNKKIYPIWTRLDDDIRSIIMAPIHDSILVVSAPVEKNPISNMSFLLKQNYPNPFNPLTTIGYNLPYPAFVTLEIFDVLGIKIKTLINEFKSAGFHENDFNAEGLNSGIYFYRLSVPGNFTETKKLIYIK